MSGKKGGKVFDEKEIMDVFKFLGLESDKNRDKIVSIKTIQPQIKQKTIFSIKADNVSAEQKMEEDKDAKLE